MKVVVTVIGKDKVGIISKVSTVLAENSGNILDISQTILEEYFTMIMVVDLTKLKVSFKELKNKLEDTGCQIGVQIKIQHEAIFNSMHKI